MSTIRFMGRGRFTVVEQFVIPEDVIKATYRPNGRKRYAALREALESRGIMKGGRAFRRLVRSRSGALMASAGEPRRR